MSTSLNEDFDFQKNKYILSIWKKVNSANPLQPPSKPDVAVIVCLLKALGFHLEKFEKQDNIDTDEVYQNNIKVTLQCGTSKMQAILKMDEVTCQCPDPDEQNGSFWSVTGSDNVNKIEETGSTLLPYISKEKNLILQCISQSLCEIIEEKNNCDANISTSSICTGMIYNNNDKNERKGAIVRSSTQPEINITGRASLPPNYKPCEKIIASNILRSISPNNSSTVSTESESSLKKLSVRQDTYELNMDIETSEEEPRIFPPKSPEVMVSNLCGSLEQISFQKSNNSILQYILTNLRNLEQVIEKHMKRPISSSQISLQDEIFQKPSAVFSETYLSNSSKSSVSRTESTTSLHNLSRSSTMLQKSNMRKSVGGSSRAGLSNEKNLQTTIKTSLKPLIEPRKSLTTPSKVISQKTSTDKTKKSYTSMSERSILTPKRRISDIGASGSQHRISMNLKPPSSTKSQTPKTLSNNKSRFGYKK